MSTISEQLTRYKGIGPGFDFLRVGLASTIVMTHAALLSGRDVVVRDSPLWFVEYALVPMFFALSGFLITGSATRLSLGNFLINRGLRIIPALAVDIFVCALIIGPIITTVPLSVYFHSPDFFKYFLNITGWIHYTLPGVFETNFSQRVNGALWTVPYEIGCYILMSLLIITRLVHSGIKTLAFTIGFLIAGVLVQHMLDAHMLTGRGAKIAFKVFVDRGSQLYAAFLMGIVIYQFKDRIPYSKIFAAVCFAICLGAIFVLDSRAIGSVPNRFIVLPALVYLVAYLGVTPIPIPRIFHTGDYSYGIYLYHDPLLQCLILMLPLSLITGPFGWIILVVCGLTAVSLLAALSWHVIEKPILGLRKKYSFVAKMRGVANEGDNTVAADMTAAKIEAVERPV